MHEFFQYAIGKIARSNHILIRYGCMGGTGNILLLAFFLCNMRGAYQCPAECRSFQLGKYRQVFMGQGHFVLRKIRGIHQVFCTFFTGIPAIVMGNRARREIRASGGVLGGEGLATAGVVTGWIGTLIVGVPLVILLVFALAGAVSASMG